MQTLATEEDPLAWLDRVSRAASRHPDVVAFEARHDAARARVVAMHDGALANAAASSSAGVAIVLYVKGASGFVSGADSSPRAIDALIERGVRLARANAGRSWRELPAALERARREETGLGARDVTQATTEEVVALLRRAGDAARGERADARVAAVLGAQTREVWHVDSAGSRVRKSSMVSTLRVGATLREGGRLGEATVRDAGERGLAELGGGEGPETLGREAVRQAEEALRAVAFPSGRYRVLCDSHLSGMLAHESFGHLTEFDLVDSGWSALRGRLGQRLAVEDVSISDAPVSPHDASRGVNIAVDDQGTRGRKVTMLERGVLRGWMHTRETAALDGVAPTGNGRALDGQYPCIVRMRNTFFEPGERTVEEALEEMRDGIYLIGARGGAPYSDGSFMFTSHRGYRVENGKLGEPVRATSIHGNVLDFLQNVRLVTRDFEIHTNFFGGCGKGPQSLLHVGLGGPHVLVESALVGGHAA